MVVEQETIIRTWLLTEGQMDPTLGWAQVDVSDLSEECPVERLFEWSLGLFRELIARLREDDLEGCAILAVPLGCSEKLEPGIPTEDEIGSIGTLVQGPGLYRTKVLLDAWQPVERFRIPISFGIENDPGVVGFYTCWRTLDERTRGEEYNRDLQYLWRLPGTGE